MLAHSALYTKIPKFRQNQTLICQMVAQSGSTRRPTCPSCSKPTRICLCNRLKTPPLHNSIAVTILQHSLEKKHPLNSARIATIGLTNVEVVTVSDVNFEARLVVRLLDESSGHVFDEMLVRGLDDENVERTHFDDARMSKTCNDDGTSSLGSSKLDSDDRQVALRRCALGETTTLSDKNEAENKEAVFTVGKYGARSSFNHRCTLPREGCTVNLDEFLPCGVAYNDVRRGFMVKKFQVKPLEGSNEYEESKEFNIVVPPGSVLLFPSEESVDIESVDFEVKNLIVLDGTWAKAKRMYNENPWLKLLPHIRLDVDQSSLYGEVRNQPRTGYLSTIESVVYALKAMGEDHEGLDGLLDVFESMVGDQRRCMNERLSKASETV